MADSYTITDDVLAPDDKIRIDFNGANPFRIYGMLPKLLQTVFHGRGKNVFEYKFKWDVTGDPREFYFVVHYEDMKFDKFTRYEMTFTTIGKQPSDPNSPDGMFYMELKGKIITEYKFKSLAEKAIAMTFIWLYHRLIYSKVRRRYMQILKERIYQVADAIRKEFGIPLEVPELTGASARLT